MCKFDIGNKVKIEGLTEDDLRFGLKIGMIGMVLTKSKEPYIRIDDWANGHDLPYEYNEAHDEKYKWDKSCWAIKEEQLSRV